MTKRLLQLATEMEGHPDNVAAALHGGFTVSWSDGGKVGAVSLLPHPEIALVAFISGGELRTVKARKALPKQVSHSDAAANSSRAALLVEALTRRPDLLMTATQDFLHQEYRRDVMPRSLALLDELRSQGVAAVVSGAGPTILALTDADHAPRMRQQARRGWSPMAIEPDRQGVQVLQMSAMGGRTAAGCYRSPKDTPMLLGDPGNMTGSQSVTVSSHRWS